MFFFQSYPALFPYLLEQLSLIRDYLGDGKGGGGNAAAQATLYPVLLILAKLQPSPNLADYPVRQYLFLKSKSFTP